MISPDPATISAGAHQTFVVEAWDGHDWHDVTAETTFEIDAPGSCAGAVCGATVAGSYTVTAHEGAYSDTATLNVSPAALDHIVISPLSASIAAGHTQAFTAAGFDVYGNARGDVTSSTTFTISGAGSCTGTACGATVAGSYTVTGHDGDLTDAATLVVTPEALDHFSVSAPDTAVAGAGVQVAVTARDVYSNTITTFAGTVEFSSSDPASTTPADYAFVTGDHGVHTFDGVTFETAGLQDFLASSGGRTGSANVTVSPAALDHLVLSPAETTIVADTTQTYTAEGFDVFGNSRGDVTSSTVFSISFPPTCIGAVCGALVSGDFTVTGTDSAKTGTAILHVTPEVIDSITISPDERDDLGRRNSELHRARVGRGR